MQRLEVSCAVRLICTSLCAKGLNCWVTQNLCLPSPMAVKQGWRYTFFLLFTHMCVCVCFRVFVLRRKKPRFESRISQRYCDSEDAMTVDTDRSTQQSVTTRLVAISNKRTKLMHNATSEGVSGTYGANLPLRASTVDK